MASAAPLRVAAAALALLLVAALGLMGGQEASGKKAKRLKLGKEGSYAQTFKNDPAIWQDDTSINVFVRNRKVVAVWVTSNYKFDGGKRCSPTGFTGALMPDQSLTGPVGVTMRPKSPVALNRKNRFRIKAYRSNPFYDNDGGYVQGRLITPKRLNVTARFSQAANPIQGRCSTSITTPKAKFGAFDVSKEIG